MSFFHGKVELKDIGHCFVSLPSKWNVNNFVPNQFNLIILKIIFLDDVKCDKYIYVTWNGTRNYQNDLVIFDRQFASKLGIVADESILVQSDSDSNKFPQCTSLDIRPLTFDDYQLISVNSGEIESELLNQLRVFTTAFCNQNEENKFNIIPIWLRSSGNVPIFVEICNFEPKSQKAIILVDSTKLIIHSPDEKIEFSNLSNNSNEDSTEEVNSSALKSMFGLFRSILPSKPQITSRHNSSDPVSTSQSNKMPISSLNKSIPIYQGQSFLVRVLPHDVNNADSTLPYCSAFISDVHFESFPEKYCLMKLRQIFTVNEKLEQTKKNAELGKNSSVPIDVSKLNTPEDKFNAQFTDKLLRNFEDITECFVLVMANSKCPPDSIQLNESFRVQKGITATSFVQLAQIDSNETSQKVSHFDQIAYLSVPVAPQISLYPINSNTVQLDSWTEEVKAQFKHLFASHSSCLNFANLFFLNSGFILKLGNFYFVAYYNETLGIDLDRCDWAKLLRNCFLLSPDTEIVLKIVPIKYDTTKLLHKLSKSIRDLDLAHLNLLYASDSSLNKPFGGFKEQFDKCAHFVRMALQLEEDEEKGKPNFALNVSILSLFSSLLICGGKGTGKSTFVNRLNRHFAKNNYVYCQTIQCSFVKGKRIESLQKSWLNSIQEAIQRQPSMLVFEDLDEIAFNADGEAKESEANSNENVSLESVYCERVAYVFSRLVDIVRKLKTSSTFSRVIIIATAKSVTNLNKIIAKSNIFNQVIELTLPDAKQRADIIEQIVHSKDLSLPDRSLRAVINFNTHQLSRATKNYKPEDLNQLLDIAVHNALVDVLRLECHNEPLPEQLSINEQNVNHALTEFTPTHLTGVNLQIHSTRSLEDVGGLHEVKEIVLNTILLPVKYPKIYAHLPLKSQNSILLYGMPGTGKTMLVEAIAHESGLNFIGVKGPELLSKYIGASEQTVRDLFGRAQAAAPSILFFDEFDSLAPRRGHDSTGVTDRIVNQMLTLLDGLEEMRQDVYILAATSRPDLIDLALLRPGRFDRCVQCHLPNEQERTEILISLARKLNIDPQTVHLEDFAKETEYFTGADLQALLYNAYLGACKRGCASSDSLQTVVISAEDMQQALGQTAASLSLKERTKFTLLYDRFVRELSGQFVATPQQKATLA